MLFTRSPRRIKLNGTLQSFPTPKWFILWHLLEITTSDKSDIYMTPREEGISYLLLIARDVSWRKDAGRREITSNVGPIETPTE